ncbi:MAG TPA: DUF308 domain-containing protein [Actinoplanes sp.]|jgi:uncharacterized membrane protein HdeD (DUF308 family)|nr:DUF308 domain-containing protein [Actinoplanes sp.]
MRSLTGSLVVRGVLALIIGIVSIAWPNITIGAIVLLFAVFAFLAGIAEAMRAFASRTAGPVIGRLLLALLDIAAGVIAIVWPDITAQALVWLVGFWALVTGVVEIFMAFRSGETAGERALFGLTGLVLIALGVVLVARPDVGAVTLAQVFGFFSIVSGIAALVLAAQTRRAAALT